MSTATEVPRHWLLRWLIDGPDPIEPSREPRLLETLLPWPVRCLIVAAAFAAGWMWRDAGVGRQLAWGLQYGALIAVAVLASFWFYALVVNLGLAALWFLPFRPRSHSVRRWHTLHFVTFLNRQAGHLEALLVWVIIALASWPLLPWQLAGLFAVLLLAPSVLNGVARMPWRWLGVASTSKDNGDLLWRRRILIYLFTFIGLGVLCAVALPQAPRLFPMIGAIFAGGLLPRYIRHKLRDRRVRAEEQDAAASPTSGRESQRRAAEEQQQARATFRAEQAAWARRADLALGPLVVLVAVGTLLGLSWRERRRLATEQQAALDGPAAPAGSCARDAHGPQQVDQSLFLMSDWQIHDLGGQRFPGQLSVADTVNRTASRPTALNVLAEAPILHFAALYQELNRKKPLRWAHLGDLADLSCRGELERVKAMMAPFDPKNLAGIAFGNHEMSFTGTFHWSPFWDRACPRTKTDEAGRMPKDVASEILHQFASQPVKDAGGGMTRLTANFFAPRGGSLVTVTPLGITRHREQPRGVIGVFLDTTDGRAFDRGIPGSFGAISGDQLEQAHLLIAAVRKKPPYDNPLYVLFSHHPSADLVGASRARVAKFVAELDGRSDGAVEAEPRVMALVAGHTHSASAHRRCLKGRLLRELVVGSTLDPPQQAALLEIGPDATGRASLRLRTIQSVSRPGLSCDVEADRPAPGTLTASECRRLAAGVLAAPECRALVGGELDAPPPRDCSQIEAARTFRDQLRGLRTDDGPIDPEAEYQAEKVQTRRLLSCVCRDRSCGTVPEDPLHEEAYAPLVSALAKRPDRQRELTCLAWAASAQQAHKEWAVTMGEALRCAFDDPTLPAERESVAALEMVSCR